MMIYGHSGQAPKPFLHLFTHYEMSPHDNNKIRIVILIYFFPVIISPVFGASKNICKRLSFGLLGFSPKLAWDIVEMYSNASFHHKCSKYLKILDFERILGISCGDTKNEF